MNLPFVIFPPQITSQNPYAETMLGQPYVYTIDIANLTLVETILKKIHDTPTVNNLTPMSYKFVFFF